MMFGDNFPRGCILIPELLLSKGISSLEGTPNFDYDKIEDRMKSLGVEKLIGEDGSIVGASSVSEYYEKLERIAILNSSKVKKRIRPYQKSDVVSAINFLETFLFYSGQRDKNSDTIEFEKFEKRIKRAINCLEEGLKALELSSRERKMIFKPQIKRVESLMNLMLADHVTGLEKLAFGKKIAIALEILHKFK